MSASLFAALARLDVVLDHAIRLAESAYGASAATDSYRGLYIPSEDIPRMLGRVAGTPLFTSVVADNPVPAFPQLERLAQIAGLEPLDQDAIVVALAPEVDRRYERLYAYLQDDVTRRRPGIDLILNLLCSTREEKLEARARFAPDSPLVRQQIARVVADPGSTPPPLLSHYLKLDEGIVQYLLGSSCIDYRLRDRATLTLPSVEEHRPYEESARRLEQVARSARQRGAPLALYFQGPRSTAKSAAATLLATRLSAPLITARLPEPTVPEFDQFVALLLREALLRDAVLYVHIDGLQGGAALWPALAAHRGVVILEGQGAWLQPPLPIATVPFAAPLFADRRRLWESKLLAAGVTASAETTDKLASRYRLSEDEVERAAQAAARHVQVTGASADESLAAAARSQGARDLGTLAQRIEAIYTWSDIVLPPDRIRLLREIANQARLRHQVYEGWGFDKKLSLGKGLTALFAGPPGTGKTMAAEVIATDLQLDLYKIDLSQVVSKYIGETEKNLSRVFTDAGRGNCILFFDECDALFGKRTEVRDAHDRYANIEVAYLLQRIEEYEGLCILATNFQQNLDPAFTRRIRFIVNIDFPAEDNRRQIWSKIWPTATPRAADVDLDFLARQFKLAGGSIRNAALSAAFLAAGDDPRHVSMRHVLHAVRREVEKTGRSMSSAEFGPLAAEMNADEARS